LTDKIPPPAKRRPPSERLDSAKLVNAEASTTSSMQNNTPQSPSATEPPPASSSPATPSTAASTPLNKTTIPGTDRRVLDLFFVDSGWNNKVGSALRENLPVFAQYLHGQRFHIMNQQQSLEFIRLHPALVGADPILIVLDRESCEQKNPGGFGFRMCLGHLQNPDAAISMLKWAVQLSMAANSTQMATMVKQSAHRQTIQGTIELMSGAHNHHLEFAPV